MLKIRKGDIVQVIKGRDKGKKGKVLNVLFGENRAFVEGINMVKKHRRQTRQDQQGGIVAIETPISISDIMFFCKNCDRPVRVGVTLGKDQVKSRICKKCKGVI